MKRSDIRTFIRKFYNNEEFVNESYRINEDNHDEFKLAAAQAKIAGKVKFAFKGKEYDVKLSDEEASEIVQKSKD